MLRLHRQKSGSDVGISRRSARTPEKHPTHAGHSEVTRVMLTCSSHISPVLLSLLILFIFSKWFMLIKLLFSHPQKQKQKKKVYQVCRFFFFFNVWLSVFTHNHFLELLLFCFLTCFVHFSVCFPDFTITPFNQPSISHNVCVRQTTVSVWSQLGF